MWNFWKWTNGKRVYTSPALTRGNRDAPTITHSYKCILLISTLSPTQPQLSNEPPIDLESKVEDMEYQEVTKWEVQDALFTVAPMNAPGITGMTGKVYQWTWTVLEDEMYHLIRLCARMGYHPREW